MSKSTGVLGAGAVTLLIFVLLLAGGGLIVFGFNILGDRAALAPFIGSVIVGIGFLVFASAGVVSVLMDIRGALIKRQDAASSNT